MVFRVGDCPDFTLDLSVIRVLFYLSRLRVSAATLVLFVNRHSRDGV